MVSWKEMLIDAFKETGDNFNNLKTTLSKEELEVKFDSGYGSSQGIYFTAWGDKYVYFPVVYDGSEWVGFAPRNICDIRTKHWGGE
ncbi:hypothetical protein UFOVP387_38 [uncultured Caudovirales phage]|uniref:Uncharacterized protein n=1 Tax=uncultured Caudovirales phage TaxID=2100421 RepID=A0A6J7X189_9CAUD|nr:hypothetical protein UFOVP387_38 [uncultured Caudovirales phage]